MSLDAAERRARLEKVFRAPPLSLFDILVDHVASHGRPYPEENKAEAEIMLRRLLDAAVLALDEARP